MRVEGLLTWPGAGAPSSGRDGHGRGREHHRAAARPQHLQRHVPLRTDGPTRDGWIGRLRVGEFEAMVRARRRARGRRAALGVGSGRRRVALDPPVHPTRLRDDPDDGGRWGSRSRAGPSAWGNSSPTTTRGAARSRRRPARSTISDRERRQRAAVTAAAGADGHLLRRGFHRRRSRHGRGHGHLR